MLAALPALQASDLASPHMDHMELSPSDVPWFRGSEPFEPSPVLLIC